jgi:hypothetical protein
MSGSLATAGLAGTGTVWFPGYANTSFEKQWNYTGGYRNAASTSDVNTEHGTGYWENSAAVTRIDLVPVLGTQFSTGSEFHLYGVS